MDRRVITAALLAALGAAGCTFDPLPASAFLQDGGALSDAAAPDAAEASDAARPDAGEGALDAGAPDLGISDAGRIDAGAPGDAGPPDAGAVCGNGVVEGTEGCDDGANRSGDGCGPTCEVASGWACEGEPSRCAELPRMSLAAEPAREGEALRVIARLSRPAPFEIRFRWSTLDGSAVAPGDYQPVVDAMVSLAPGSSTATLTVSLEPDAAVEPIETFEVILDAIEGARPATLRIEAVIVDVLPLADRGLVARYFLDDAIPGQPLPSVLRDAAPDPLDLDVVRGYFGTPDPFEAPTGRGLAWNRRGRDGRVGAFIDGTKVRARLDGSTTATLEVVVEAFDAENASRLIHIGGRFERGQLSFLLSPTTVFLAYDGDALLQWAAPMGLFGRRAVLTVVWDSASSAPEARARLYVDGQPQGASSPALAEDEEIEIPEDRALVLGNRVGGDLSIDGRIYYGAVYDSALSAAEVMDNAAALLARDDP